MKSVISTSTILLVLLAAAVLWPSRERSATANCQTTGTACNRCQTECERQGDALMDNCVRWGNDWNFCKDKRTEEVRKCGQAKCPDCSWIQTY